MEMPSVTPSTPELGLVGDHRGLEKLRKMGLGDKKSQAQALKAAAEQFESLLMQYWVDAMRSSNDTLNPDSPLHSKYSSFFEDMLSQQQVGQMVSSQGKFSKNSITYLIAKQFSKTLGDAGKELMKELESGMNNTSVRETFVGGYGTQSAVPYREARLRAAKVEGSASTGDEVLPDAGNMRNFESPQDFVDKMMPYAVKAAEGLGFNPLVIVAQAALETGWGEHVPSGNNYFGIKAGGSWQGESEALSSPEFENGQFVNEVSRFRKYKDVLSSMKDYIDFIKGNPRYHKAVDKSFDPDTYFEEIAKAGYATDPHYADKLKNISRKIAFMAYK
ncbi:MAG: glucosaminidase domain-containing protein [Succinivibrio sp.]|nr:glucosaminidase domain-containing protein [Succinivibrio sp.]